MASPCGWVSDASGREDTAVVAGARRTLAGRPCVTDICINRPGEVWVERLGAWLLRAGAARLRYPGLDRHARGGDDQPRRRAGQATLCDHVAGWAARSSVPATGCGAQPDQRHDPPPASFSPTVGRLAEGGLFVQKPERKTLADRLAVAYGDTSSSFRQP